MCACFFYFCTRGRCVCYVELCPLGDGGRPTMTRDGGCYMYVRIYLGHIFEGGGEGRNRKGFLNRLKIWVICGVGWTERGALRTEPAMVEGEFHEGSFMDGEGGEVFVLFFGVECGVGEVGCEDGQPPRGWFQCCCRVSCIYFILFCFVITGKRKEVRLCFGGLEGGCGQSHDAREQNAPPVAVHSDVPSLPFVSSTAIIIICHSRFYFQHPATPCACACPPSVLSNTIYLLNKIIQSPSLGWRQTRLIFIRVHPIHSLATHERDSSAGQMNDAGKKKIPRLGTSLTQTKGSKIAPLPLTPELTQAGGESQLEKGGALKFAGRNVIWVLRTSTKQISFFFLNCEGTGSTSVKVAHIGRTDKACAKEDTERQKLLPVNYRFGSVAPCTGFLYYCLPSFISQLQIHLRGHPLTPLYTLYLMHTASSSHQIMNEKPSACPEKMPKSAERVTIKMRMAFKNHLKPLLFSCYPNLDFLIMIWLENLQSHSIQKMGCSLKNRPTLFLSTSCIHQHATISGFIIHLCLQFPETHCSSRCIDPPPCHLAKHILSL
ncbi:hypothetical protein VP01_1564g2 [Puccinia sorghi]|uniref:Uncharacterized protein n=1 Tax=Puccinia sorghi TaxID=27349 RepID=A0A0L6VJT1_9BASI|nr:hypothetical protein VP01_1564g2 [Puccinia sorghi]